MIVKTNGLYCHIACSLPNHLVGEVVIHVRLVGQFGRRLGSPPLPLTIFSTNHCRHNFSSCAVSTAKILILSPSSHFLGNWSFTRTEADTLKIHKNNSNLFSLPKNSPTLFYQFPFIEAIRVRQKHFIKVL